jgi:hypothetical protein
MNRVLVSASETRAVTGNYPFQLPTNSVPIKKPIWISVRRDMPRAKARARPWRGAEDTPERVVMFCSFRKGASGFFHERPVGCEFVIGGRDPVCGDSPLSGHRQPIEAPTIIHPPVVAQAGNHFLLGACFE